LEENNPKKVPLSDLESFKKALKSNQLGVCVIGIGRIGLPTALSFANSGLKTIGVDINENLINSINSKKFPLKDEPGYEEIFHTIIKKNNFHVTTKIEDTISHSQIFLLSLPTPMNENNIPDYSALKSVGTTLGKLMEPNSLVIVESTIEPGFIENELVKIIEGNNHRLTVGKNFSIGVCPENANPGEILHDFTNLPCLIGGIDEHTTEILMEIYHHVFPVELIKMPNCKSANAVKLTTNVFRDVNIAFVNELSILFEKLGIDTLKVLEAAKKKYNFQIHLPGAGVGGPCLPVNSYQLLNSARRVNTELKIVEKARQINEKMPDHVIDLSLSELKKVGKPIEQCIILVLGISYKPDVKDIQLTPAEVIIRKLLDLGANVRIFDPYFIDTKVFNIDTENNFLNAISGVDLIILVTAHKEFHDIDPTLLVSKMKTPIFIDSRGIMNDIVAQKAGLIFRGLGRGRS